MFAEDTDSYWLDWGPEKADALAGEIVAEKTSEKKPAEEKRALFSYGMPGSGKTRLLETLSRADTSVVYLSIDEIFRRSPHFAEVVRPQRFNRHDDPFSDRCFLAFGGDVMGCAVERLRQMPYSVSIDGLGGPMLAQMYKYFGKSGYRNQILITAVPKRIMDMNMLTRFIGARTGRDEHFSFTLQRSKKMVEYYAAFVGHLQRTGFNLQIVNPGSKKILYESNLGKNDAAKIFLREFSRPLTKSENAELRHRRELLLPRVESIDNPFERRQLRNALAGCLRPFAAPEYKYEASSR